MDAIELNQLLENVASGKTSISHAAKRLSQLPFASVGTAKVDHHRPLRTGVPELIYGESKSASQILEIFQNMTTEAGHALASRVSQEKWGELADHLTEADYDASCGLLVQGTCSDAKGLIGVAYAGSSDEPVAREVIGTAEYLGHAVLEAGDVGIAGIHRVVHASQALKDCDALVVVAGMEGALPTALAGLLSVPMIAVPTSVGYGVSLGGLAALTTMLSTCAPGVTVVNIDNGIGAAVAASLIARRSA